MPKAEALDVERADECLHLLNELSLSYMSVYASSKTLEELNSSLKELRAFVECLQARYEESPGNTQALYN